MSKHVGLEYNLGSRLFSVRLHRYVAPRRSLDSFRQQQAFGIFSTIECFYTNRMEFNWRSGSTATLNCEHQNNYWITNHVNLPLNRESSALPGLREVCRMLRILDSREDSKESARSQSMSNRVEGRKHQKGHVSLLCRLKTYQRGLTPLMLPSHCRLSVSIRSTREIVFRSRVAQSQFYPFNKISIRNFLWSNDRQNLIRMTSGLPNIACFQCMCLSLPYHLRKWSICAY